MTLALSSEYDGTIRFYREPKRNGGHLLAIFPADRGGRVGPYRDALTVNGYDTVHVDYVRNRCRPADRDHDHETAYQMLKNINARAEYVQSLMAPIR